MPIRSVDIDGREVEEDLNETEKSPEEMTSEEMGLKPAPIEEYKPLTEEERFEQLEELSKLGRNNGNKTAPMFETLPGGQQVAIPNLSTILKEPNNEEIEKKQEEENESKGKNPYSGKNRNELVKSRSSFEKLIREHKQKLEDYIKNPMKYDNKDLLKNAPSKEVFNKIIAGRVKELFNQITKQEKELDKVNNALKDIEKTDEAPAKKGTTTFSSPANEH